MVRVRSELVLIETCLQMRRKLLVDNGIGVFSFFLRGFNKRVGSRSLESRAKRPSEQPVARRGDGTVEYSRPQLERLSRNPWEFEKKLREHDIDVTKATNRRFVEH